MGRNGGSNNSSVNGRSVSWQKSKRIKARVAKKLVGTKERHKATVKAVSGARTKKHQRKVDRKKRLAEKEVAAFEAAMDVEIAPAGKKNKKAKKSSTTAAEGLAAMQE